ncbi:MAG: hypothetical protein LBT98_01965 [Puniceicoccales bacterium]|jgi:hypothetical protein|nr:hypothetical protein [Puniceicoccales bacterium]
METAEIALITLFVHVDDLCKENRWDFRHDLGRKFGLHFSEVWTIYAAFQLSGMRHFNRFYDGLYGKWLRPYFPKMPSYSVFLRRLQLREAVVGDFQSFTQAILNFFIVDSTPFELCKIVRSWRSCLFEEHADWAISATKKIY